MGNAGLTPKAVGELAGSGKLIVNQDTLVANKYPRMVKTYGDTEVITNLHTDRGMIAQ